MQNREQSELELCFVCRLLELALMVFEFSQSPFYLNGLFDFGIQKTDVLPPESSKTSFCNSIVNFLHSRTVQELSLPPM